MASPPEITIENLNGRFRMSKTLTDEFDSMLALQGMGWLLRKAIGLASLTQHITSYTPAGDATHIDIQQYATMGIDAGPENRTLDWVEHGKKDAIFGEVRGKNRFIKFKDMQPGEGQEDADYLNATWEDGPDGLRVQGYSWNPKAGWKANQIWGFEEIDGTRYHTRRCVVSKGDQVKKVRFVYEYLGPLES